MDVGESVSIPFVVRWYDVPTAYKTDGHIREEPRDNSRRPELWRKSAARSSFELGSHLIHFPLTVLIA